MSIVHCFICLLMLVIYCHQSNAGWDSIDLPTITLVMF